MFFRIGLVTQNYEKTNSNELSLNVSNFIEIINELNEQNYLVKTTSSNNINKSFPKDNLTIFNCNFTLNLLIIKVKKINVTHSLNPFESNEENSTDSEFFHGIFKFYKIVLICFRFIR